MTAISELLTDNIGSWTEAVKPKASAGRGGGSRDDLYGVKKLRELILDLAVRGLLGPQNPGDSPAQQLLAEAEAERELSISEGRAKKQKVLSSVTEEEKTFSLPRGWSWVRFGNLFTLEYGDNLPEKKRSGTGEYPVYGSNGVVGSHNSYCVQGRCIVIGRKGSAGALNLSATEYCWVTDVAYSLVPPSCLSVDFVYWLLHTLRLDSLGKGIKPGLSRSDANQLVFGLPPVSEQHRIVSKINELMALCDKLEAQKADAIEAHKTLVTTVLDALTKATEKESFDTAWARIAEYFDTLFTTEWSVDQLEKATIKLAVRGRLSSEVQSDETAQQLLTNLGSERDLLTRKGLLKKQKVSTVSDSEIRPFKVPENWTWARLPLIGELARGKSKHRPRNDPALYSDGTVPLVQTGDVARAKSGKVMTYSALYNSSGVAQSRLWPKGTLCITIAANIADTAILSFEACFPDSVVGFTPFLPDLDVRYFDYFIRTAKEDLEEFAPSTAQKNINLEILGDVLVPLPPLPEMKVIISKLEVLGSIFDQMRLAIRESQKTQLLLSDAITEQAVAEPARGV